MRSLKKENTKLVQYTYNMLFNILISYYRLGSRIMIYPFLFLQQVYTIIIYAHACRDTHKGKTKKFIV